MSSNTTNVAIASEHLSPTPIIIRTFGADPNYIKQQLRIVLSPMQIRTVSSQKVLFVNALVVDLITEIMVVVKCIVLYVMMTILNL